MSASQSKRKFFVIAFLLAMTVCNVVMVADLIAPLRNGYQDFTIYYTAATLLRDGHARTLYDLTTQYRTQASFTRVPIRLGPLPYNHPPFEALIFLPFTLLGYWHGYLIWTAVNIGLLIATIALLRKNIPQISELSAPMAALGATAFFPIVLGIMQGQDVVLMLFLCAGALICLDQSKDAAAGAWLGLGLFRPHLALAIVALLVLRRWRMLLGFIPVAVALGAVTVAILGWSGPVDYARFVLRVEKTPARGFGPQAVPNFRGLFSSLPGIHASPHTANILILIFSLAVFAMAAYRIYVYRDRCSDHGRDEINYCFGLATVTALLVSFHVLTYDLVLLLPLALFFVANLLRGGKLNTATAFAFLLYLTPLYVILMFVTDSFYWFSLVLIGLYLMLISGPGKLDPVNFPV